MKKSLKYAYGFMFANKEKLKSCCIINKKHKMAIIVPYFVYNQYYRYQDYKMMAMIFSDGIIFCNIPLKNRQHYVIYYLNHRSVWSL